MTIMHLMVPDSSGTIQIGPSKLVAVGEGTSMDLSQSNGGRWRVACGRPMKWVQEQMRGGDMHICTPETEAILTEKPSHCPKCRQSPEFLNDPVVAARLG